MLFPILLLFSAVTGFAILSKRSQSQQRFPPPGVRPLPPPPVRLAPSPSPLPPPTVASMYGGARMDFGPSPQPQSLASMHGAISIAGTYVSPVELLYQACEQGMEVPTSLVVDALTEAAENGDAELFRQIVAAFPPIASGEQSTVIGKASAPHVSMIRGVNDEQWRALVSALRTQDPSFKDGRHVGAFHHNVKRIIAIGIDPETLSDETEQYKALAADIILINDECRKLINDWCGDVIRINGESTPITHSGVIGLIKAAGVEGAKQWLTSEESRMKYPNTTKQFLSTNGIF